MAGIASRAQVLIPGDSLVVICHISRIIVFVAKNTTEQREIAWCGVAFNALIPFPIVRTTVYREIILVVIPSGRLPSIGCVTILTSCWELGRLVIRIIGAIVISGVTTKTSGRRIIEIAV